MGRAYEVRKKDIQKTGAAKAKLYSMYAREIYDLAKKGGTEVSSNASLKRVIDRAKKEQVPSDIINRAIEKVNSGIDENYQRTKYELFGPGGSTIIADCLTDNLNRTVSNIKTVVNKCHIKMGAMGSVSFNYDNLCIVGFKGITEEEVIDAMILNDVDIDDIETNDDMVVVYGNPSDLFKIKDAISKIKEVEFDIDEITMLPKEKITLTGEDEELFNRTINMLEEIEDVQNVYHNVN